MRGKVLFLILSLFLFLSSCEDKTDVNQTEEHVQSALHEKENKSKDEINGKYVNYGFLYTFGDNLKRNGFSIKYTSNKKEKNGYTKIEAYDNRYYVGSFSLNYNFNANFGKRYFYASIHCIPINNSCSYSKKFAIVLINSISDFYGLPKEKVAYVVEPDENKTVRIIIGENPPIVFSLIPKIYTGGNIDIKIYEYKEVKDWFSNPDSNVILNKL